MGLTSTPPGNATSDTIIYEAFGGSGGSGGPNLTNLTTSNPDYRIVVWAFDPSAYESLYLLVPKERLAGWSSIDVSILAGNSGTGTGNVLWRLQHTWVTPTTTLAVSSTTHSEITWTATDRDVMAEVSLATGISVTADKDLRLNIQRRGPEAGDTLANDAGVARVILGKAS